MVGHLRHSRHFTFRVQDGDQRRQPPADWAVATARPTPPFFSFLSSGMPFRARELKAALWVWAVHTVSGVSECLLSRETRTVMAATAASQTRVNHAMPYHATLCIFDGESLHSVLQPLTPSTQSVSHSVVVMCWLG